VLPNYDEKYVTHLFNQMGPSYDIMNVVTSFGFSEIWRRQCVGNLKIPAGAIVADLMAGSGECWTYLRRPVRPGGKIISIDISPVMCARQEKRVRCLDIPVEVRCESALNAGLADHSVDFIISAFGLKTFDPGQLSRLAKEMFRILRPGGRCSLLEISVPESNWLRAPYRFYISKVIPLVGRFFLKDIECYKMLGVYTEAFGSCRRVVEHFEKVGFRVAFKTHFYGCASSLVMIKP